jgi:hypothetical protein
MNISSACTSAPRCLRVRARVRSQLTVHARKHGRACAHLDAQRLGVRCGLSDDHLGCVLWKGLGHLPDAPQLLGGTLRYYMVLQGTPLHSTRIRYGTLRYYMVL